MAFSIWLLSTKNLFCVWSKNTLYLLQVWTSLLLQTTGEASEAFNGCNSHTKCYMERHTRWLIYLYKELSVLALRGIETFKNATILHTYAEHTLIPWKRPALGWEPQYSLTLPGLRGGEISSTLENLFFNSWFSGFSEKNSFAVLISK